MKRGVGIDEAFDLVARRLGPRDPVVLGVEEALGHVLATAPRAAADRPPFDRSAMDGYALRSDDAAGAAPGSPVRLRVIGESAAGSADPPGVKPGETARIFTGAPLPPGTDAVVRQERVERHADTIAIAAPVPPWNDVRRRAEEAPAGTAIGRAGIRLGPGAVAALADAGVADVRVHPRARVAGLVTGGELTPAGRSLGPGEVHDVNGPLLRTWLGASARVEYVGDDRDATRSAIETLLADADLVVTTGGVSVGDHDHVIDAAGDAGVDPVFWRVLQKPGGPLFFGVRGSAALLGLPGNPASVFAGLVTFTRLARDVLDGAAPPGPRWLAGVAGSPLPRTARRESWIRARLRDGPDGRPRLDALPGQASHMLGNLLDCDALVRVPAGEGALPPDTPVSWTNVRD